LPLPTRELQGWVCVQVIQPRKSSWLERGEALPAFRTESAR